MKNLLVPLLLTALLGCTTTTGPNAPTEVPVTRMSGDQPCDNLAAEVCAAYNTWFDWLHGHPNATACERNAELAELFEYILPIARATEGCTIPEEHVWPEDE